MATNNAWNNTVLDADVTLNGGTVNIGTDNASNAITIGTGSVGRLINIGLSAAAHTLTIGNTNTTTSISMQSGTGNTVVNSSGTTTVTGTGGVTLNSISGVINIGDGANANAINIGTGAAARTITVGNTTGATAVNMNIGTGDFTMASASGTLVSQLDTGEMIKPLQPAFLAQADGTQVNVTGNNTVVTINFPNVIFNQGSDYDGTNTFTAPVTGRYLFNYIVRFEDVTAAATTMNTILSTSNRSYRSNQYNAGAIITSGGAVAVPLSMICDMDASDTCVCQGVINGMPGDTVDIAGSVWTFFSGSLIC